MSFVVNIVYIYDSCSFMNYFYVCISYQRFIIYYRTSAFTKHILKTTMSLQREKKKHLKNIYFELNNMCYLIEIRNEANAIFKIYL